MEPIRRLCRYPADLMRRARALHAYGVAAALALIRPDPPWYVYLHAHLPPLHARTHSVTTGMQVWQIALVVAAAALPAAALTMRRLWARGALPGA